MTTLYFIRHAESEANAKRLFASTLPFSLTAAGKADADRIAAELKDLTNIDRIVSSPLRRAAETAESFAVVFGLPIEMDSRLSEQDLGAFSGLSYDAIKNNPDYEQDAMARWDWVPRGGGESYRMIADRVRGFFESIERDRPEGSTLVVTHAVTFRLIQATLENTLPAYPKEFPNNGEIRKTVFEGLGRVHRFESIFLGNSRLFVHNP